MDALYSPATSARSAQTQLGPGSPVAVGDDRGELFEARAFGIARLATGDQEMAGGRDPTDLIERAADAAGSRIGDHHDRVPILREAVLRIAQRLGGPLEEIPVADPERQCLCGAIGVADLAGVLQRTGEVVQGPDLGRDVPTDPGEVDGRLEQRE